MTSKLVIELSGNSPIEIGATGLPGLIQEIRTVLSTRKGSVPLDREFGVSWDMIDRPLPQFLPLIVAEYGRALARYVPRVRLAGVDFSGATEAETGNGVVRPSVTVAIREEYLNEFR